MSRTDWLLGLSLLIVLVMVVVLGVFFWQQSRLDAALPDAAGDLPLAAAAGIEPTPPFAGQTALVAFGRAQQRALQWHADAELVSASATWPQGATLESVTAGEASWSFSFYSPSGGEGAAVSVVEDQATLGQSRPVRAALNPRAAGAWKINSAEAIDIFTANGGEAFFQNEQNVTFSIKLSTVTESGRVEWLLAAVSNTSGKSMTMWLDATSGDIIDVQEVP